VHVYFEKEETVEQRSNIVLEPALLIFLPTPKHTEHRSSPFPTTPHHSSPLPTTPRHSSPLLTTPHHSSPFLTTPTSIGAKWLLYLTVPKWVPLAPIGAIFGTLSAPHYNPGVGPRIVVKCPRGAKGCPSAINWSQLAPSRCPNGLHWFESTRIH
jgi:hypothetical protein